MVRVDGVDNYNIGEREAKIAEKRSVFNAIANDLNFNIGRDVATVTFVVEHEGNELLVRTYPVSSLFEIKNKNETKTYELVAI